MVRARLETKRSFTATGLVVLTDRRLISLEAPEGTSCHRFGPVQTRGINDTWPSHVRHRTAWTWTRQTPHCGPMSTRALSRSNCLGASGRLGGVALHGRLRRSANGLARRSRTRVIDPPAGRQQNGAERCAVRRLCPSAGRVAAAQASCPSVRPPPAAPSRRSSLFRLLTFTRAPAGATHPGFVSCSCRARLAGLAFRFTSSWAHGPGLTRHGRHGDMVTERWQCRVGRSSSVAWSGLVAARVPYVDPDLGPHLCAPLVSEQITLAIAQRHLLRTCSDLSRGVFRRQAHGRLDLASGERYRQDLPVRFR